MDEKRVLAATRHWIDAVVIGLDLCPFARHSIASGRLRIQVSATTDAAELQQVLAGELRLLKSQADALDSTLLVHPNALRRFLDFNDFLDVADATLESESLRGEIQIASFHPDYRFEGTGSDEVGNYTNRSPHPMLHLICEDAISRVVAAHPDPQGIPARNIARLESLGEAALQKLLVR